MTRSGTPSAAEVSALVIGSRVDRLLGYARSARSPSMRRWLLDALERALMLADPGAVSRAQRDEAVALGASKDVAAVADVAPPPHAVSIPFAALDGTTGLVRMVHVAWQATGDEAGPLLGGASRDAIAHALDLARGFAEPGKEIGQYRLRATQPEGAALLRVSGASLGAATFVSAVALWSGRRVRPGTVITGTLTATGVDAVGHLGEKLEAALEGRADVERVIVPSRNAPAIGARAGGVPVIEVATHEALLDAALEPAGVGARPDVAVLEARSVFERGWQGFRWPAQLEPLERLAGELPDGRPDLRVAVLTMWGAVSRHLGAPDASLSVLERARALAESEDGREAVPDLPLTELHQHLALTLRQLCRFEQATEAADEAVRIARAARLRGELLEAHGCAGIVALSRGRADEAVRHQREALDIVHVHRPSSCPRTHGYLIEALGRAGDLAAARAQWAEALAHLDAHPQRDRATREVWLRTSFASALAARGCFDEVSDVLEVPLVAEAIARDPLPGLLARRWLGLARVTGPAPEAGWALLAASPAAHGRGLMPHVRFLAYLNVLFEAGSRLDHGAFGDDARERTRRALEHLPAYGDAQDYLGTHAREVARALDRGQDAGLSQAIARLLDHSLRIA